MHDILKTSIKKSLLIEFNLIYFIFSSYTIRILNNYYKKQITETLPINKGFINFNSQIFIYF